MNAKDSIQETAPYVLVEGPRWGDAEFYGKWLLAVAEADALWEEAIKDVDFSEQPHALAWDVLPYFGVSAVCLLSQLKKNHSSILLGLKRDEWCFDAFAMMVDMGFFVLTGERYQMVVPTGLNMGKVKTAALKLNETAVDQKWNIHPEFLVATMPYRQAKEWQARLRRMDEDQRCADRLLLLDSSADGAPPVALPL